MNEHELLNVWRVRDRLIADKASHVANETFCLVVPTDDDNCGLLDPQSHRIVGALTWQQGPSKQAKHRSWCAG